MATKLTMLGIESSCDETGAAVVRGGGGDWDDIGGGPSGDRPFMCDGPGEILSNIVIGQDALHAAFGGVVPEIAARAHVEKLDFAVTAALEEAGVNLADLDGIAVTAGPGLIGGVMSGVMCAKGIAAVTGLPLLGVNHLAGHALTPRLTDGLSFPYLMLLVSGGHCQFLAVQGPDAFTRIGGTIDDAPGEAFDKTAKLLGLGYPGGPAVEREAKQGDPGRFVLPRPLLDRAGCDMSFSGLKTAIRRQLEAVTVDGAITAQDRRDLCAGFQAAVADVLVEKSRRAVLAFRDLTGDPGHVRFAVAGGVAANRMLGNALSEMAAAHDSGLIRPPLRLCTDNAAMIAWAGIERFAAGTVDDLSLAARPRWPLDRAAAPMLGSGKKGAKA